MSEKSFVSMGQAVCPACGKVHDTNELLIDKRMRNSMERHTITGWAMCEEHQKRLDDGFVILAACDFEKSDKEPDGTVKPQGAYRLGEFAYIRRTIWSEIFSMPMPPKGLGFCDLEVIRMLERMQLDPNSKEGDRS